MTLHLVSSQDRVTEPNVDEEFIEKVDSYDDKMALAYQEGLKAFRANIDRIVANSVRNGSTVTEEADKMLERLLEKTPR